MIFCNFFSKSFPFTELGRIYELLPLKEMAAELASHLPKIHPQGNTPMFPPEGENEPMTVSTARRIICNLRTTVMEGSFGIQKRYIKVGFIRMVTLKVTQHETAIKVVDTKRGLHLSAQPSLLYCKLIAIKIRN